MIFHPICQEENTSLNSLQTSLPPSHLAVIPHPSRLFSNIVSVSLTSWEWEWEGILLSNNPQEGIPRVIFPRNQERWETLFLWRKASLEDGERKKNPQKCTGRKKSFRKAFYPFPPPVHIYTYLRDFNIRVHQQKLWIIDFFLCLPPNFFPSPHHCWREKFWEEFSFALLGGRFFKGSSIIGWTARRNSSESMETTTSFTRLHSPPSYLLVHPRTFYLLSFQKKKIFSLSLSQNLGVCHASRMKSSTI